MAHSRVRSPADPYLAFQFQISVGSAHGTDMAGGFSDVQGLGVETEVETLRQGGQNHSEVMLAGASKFPSRLVLKRGLGDTAKLWLWHQKIIKGMIIRENVTISMVPFDWERKKGRHQWVFRHACPIKWTGPELHAATSAVAFETIELVHKGLVLDRGH